MVGKAGGSFGGDHHRWAGVGGGIGPWGGRRASTPPGRATGPGHRAHPAHADFSAARIGIETVGGGLGPGEPWPKPRPPPGDLPRDHPEQVQARGRLGQGGLPQHSRAFHQWQCGRRHLGHQAFLRDPGFLQHILCLARGGFVRWWGVPKDVGGFWFGAAHGNIAIWIGGALGVVGGLRLSAAQGVHAGGAPTLGQWAVPCDGDPHADGSGLCGVGHRGATGDPGGVPHRWAAGTAPGTGFGGVRIQPGHCAQRHGGSGDPARGQCLSKGFGGGGLGLPVCLQNRIGGLLHRRKKAGLWPLESGPGWGAGVGRWGAQAHLGGGLAASGKPQNGLRGVCA